MEEKKKNKQMIFNKIYLVKSKLNAGSFGEVFLGKNIQTNQKVAIKLEEIKEDMPDINRSLLREASILNHIGSVPGVPKLYWFGTENNYDVMVLELLGKDLASIVKSYKRLTMGTIVLIALNVLQILQNIHEKDVIHRDIKPDNILMGIEEKSEHFYLIDFGISKCFRDPKGRHLIFRENKPFIGTTRYASVHSHMGHELSRRDDLESLGYVLLYLANGYLPWQNVEGKAKEKTYQVGKIKKKIKVDELCKHLPKAFQYYFDYIRELEFNETPDYEFIKGIFEQIAKESKLIIKEIVLDWRSNKDKIAEFLLGTNKSSKSIDNKKFIRSNERALIKTEIKEEFKANHKNTILSCDQNKALNSPTQTTNGKNNPALNNSSLNNFYVPSKSYLKEDKFEDSSQNNIKNEGTLMSLTNSVYSKCCINNKSNNSSLHNFYIPSKMYIKEDKFEDCNEK